MPCYATAFAFAWLLAGVGRSEYTVGDNDVLRVEVAGLPAKARPLDGDYSVESGTVELGKYGRVPVAGLTRAQARRAVAAHLADQFGQKRRGQLRVWLEVAESRSRIYYAAAAGRSGQYLAKPGDTVVDVVLRTGPHAAGARPRLGLAAGRDRRAKREPPRRLGGDHAVGRGGDELRDPGRGLRGHRRPGGVAVVAA